MSLLELEQLLSPISEERPCGVAREEGDIDFQNAYFSIREAITTARGIEAARRELGEVPPDHRDQRYADYEGRPNNPRNNPHWDEIAHQCIEFLSHRSKDAQILQWLIESMSQVYGYHGFIESVDATTQMIERFGDNLHPKEADDPTYALSFVAGVCKSSTFLDSLKNVPLSLSCPISYSSKATADLLDNGSLSSSDRDSWLAEGAMSYDDIQAALRESQPTDRREFLQTLDQAIAAAIRLDALMQQRAGNSGLRFTAARDQLQSVRSWFASILPEEEEATASEAIEDETAVATTVARSTPSGQQGLVSRDDALKHLLKVAEYFRKTEPHSPLSYALEQAVRWGKMPLPDLLKDLIDNRDVLSEIYRRMGIQPQEPSDE